MNVLWNVIKIFMEMIKNVVQNLLLFVHPCLFGQLYSCFDPFFPLRFLAFLLLLLFRLVFSTYSQILSFSLISLFFLFSRK